MKKCTTCRYSRHDRHYQGHSLKSETLFCYVTPTIELAEISICRENVTLRPAICGKYEEETPEELFDDLDLEMLLPELPESRHQRRHIGPAKPNPKGIIRDLDYYKRQGMSQYIAYKTLMVFRDKGYPMSEKIMDFMKRFELANPSFLK